MKTVLITGARSGLGLALAREFLGKGWRVIAAGRRMTELPDDVRTNPNTTTVELELSDEETVRACANTLVGVPIDVLINNAGVYDSGPADDDTVVSTLDAIARVFIVNAIAPRLLADVLLPNLALGSERLIVGISSGMGTFAQLQGRDLEPTSRGTDGYEALHWVYSASKTALNYALLAFGVSHSDIKVSLINPGWMQTAIGGKDAPESTDKSAEHIAELILNHQTRLPAGELVDHLGNKMEL
jgi:NAD(P)-dependent dehydrogenase (short-subunit alcohol dehydrogenase family)